VKAHSVKLEIGFAEALAAAYGQAGGAVNQLATIIWKRSKGAIRTAAEYDKETDDVFGALAVTRTSDDERRLSVRSR
jgi:hypothetical protein